MSSSLAILEHGAAEAPSADTDLALAEAAPLDWATLLSGPRPSRLALARLEPEVMTRASKLLDEADRVAALVKGGLSQAKALDLTAPATGYSRSRWETMLLEYKRDGWGAFVDKRTLPAVWSGCRPGVAAELVKQFSALVCSNQRPLSGRSAHLVLKERLGRLPRGASYANLMRLGPDRYTRAAAKQGAAAARAHRAPARFTRQHGWVMGRISMDDVWLDQWSLFPAFSGRLPQIARGVGGVAGDYYSGKLFAHFLKPRLRRADGTCENLCEWEFLCFAELIFRTIGFSQRGTRMLLENMTATIRKERADALKLATDGLVTVEYGGKLRKVATRAQWGARGGGNPRSKGWLESLWNLLHNRCGFLPGQMGLSPDKGPEDIAHLLRYTERLIEDAVREQGGAGEGAVLQALRMPLLWWGDYAERVSGIVGQINDRHDHELEGWDAHIIVDPASGERRRRSPSEVWGLEAHTLQRIDDAGSALILGTRNAKPYTVTNGEIRMSLARVSSSKLIFNAAAVGLANEQKVLVVVNELAPDRAFVFTLLGEFIVAAPRLERADAFTEDSRLAEYGRVAALETRQQKRVREIMAPAAQARLELQAHNAGVIAGARAARGLEDKAGAAARAEFQAQSGVGTASAPQTSPESATGGVAPPPVSPPKRFRLGAF